MPKINVEITPRSFEIIRDRIVDILVEEIANQVDNGFNTAANAKVHLERFIPFDKTELPAINVCFASGNSDSRDAASSSFVYVYNIDAHSNAVDDDEALGDTKASVLCQKILGICQAILEDPQYRTLGFAPPSISGLYVSSINMIDPSQLQVKDALSSTWGRIQLTVKGSDSNNLLNAVLLAGYQTRIKIGDTLKGFFNTTP